MDRTSVYITRYLYLDIYTSSYFPESYAFSLAARQQDIPWLEKDYSYIDFFRKAYENETDPEQKMVCLSELRDSEARRDFFTGSVRQIHNLIQIGLPNLELKEARCEIYKISVSFRPRGKIMNFIKKITIKIYKFYQKNYRKNLIN